jgi:hypothetical protein
MSTMSPSTQVRETLRDSRAAQLTELVRRPVEAMAFWAAIVLPFVYLPLLVGGFDDTTSLLLFVGLVAANVLALFVGHDHKRE